MNVLVTGGTGTLGRHVVTRLRQSGHRARILSRNPRGHVDAVQGDLKTGQGIDKAVVGMEGVVHAATSARQSLSGRSDIKATRRLLERARHAGITHFVYVSIVGIDASSYPYHRTKLAVEKIVRESEVPWSILRATQFHDLMDVMLRGFSRVPGLTVAPFAWQLQPVDAREVAARVVDVLLGKPGGLLADFGGPEIRDMKTIAASWLMARKERRRLVNLPIPFEFNQQFAQGKLTTPEHRDGITTFDEYLIERYALR